MGRGGIVDNLKLLTWGPSGMGAYPPMGPPPPRIPPYILTGCHIWGIIPSIMGNKILGKIVPPTYL